MVAHLAAAQWIPAFAGMTITSGAAREAARRHYRHREERRLDAAMALRRGSVRGAVKSPPSGPSSRRKPGSMVVHLAAAQWIPAFAGMTITRRPSDISLHGGAARSGHEDYFSLLSKSRPLARHGGGGA
jgi:hypothetical protein